MKGRPLSVRLGLRLFAWAARLLPSGFRVRYLADARRDLEDTLGERHGTGGALAALWAGAVAVLDVVRRIPVEWWAALAGRPDDEHGSGSEPGWGGWTMSWTSDLKVAVRTLKRRPLYTVAAVTTLALGIGANAAIFSVVNGILLRPLPYPDADRIVSVLHHAPGLNLPTLENSPGTLRVYREGAPFFQSLAAYDRGQANLVGGAEPERVSLVWVTPQIFDVLGVQPALGRPFGAADAAQDAPPVIILTHAAWVSRFGRAPDVLGRTIELDGVATEIVGVMPPGFAFPDDKPAGLVPLYVDPQGPFGTFGTAAVARLAPGVTVAQAQARANDLQSRLPELFDVEQDFLDKAGWNVTVERLQDRLVGENMASTLWIVLGTVGFVLLIACANVANLFLVRAESRQKELAIRSAMGAGSGRIAGVFLAEALLLGLAGGAVGLLLAWGGVSVLVARGPADLPRLHEISVDGATLAFSAVISVLASLAFGAIPVARYTGRGLARVLRDGGRASTDGRERHRTRSVLVAAQLSLALVLLVGSGLMLRSFDQLRRVDPGFNPADVLTVGLSLGDHVANDEAARFYARVADEVRALPGVASVGLTQRIPLGEGSSNGGSFYIESKPRDDNELPPVAMYKAVDESYFQTMDIPVLQGRGIARSDWEGGQAVAVVNQAFADRYLDGDAVGQAVRWDTAGAWARVVGVVGEVREQGLREPVHPWAYLPLVEGDWGYPNLDRIYLMVRGAGTVPLSVASIRQIVTRLNPSVPVTTVRTMDEVMSRTMAPTTFTMVLLGVAAGVALFLGAIGLFGVISYVVSQRTREIGVRVALGAGRDDIRHLVFRQGAGVAVAGVLVGMVAAFALSRLLGAVLFQVSATDPLTFVGAPVVLGAIAVLATWLPARRAARVDPLEALRSE